MKKICILLFFMFSNPVWGIDRETVNQELFSLVKLGSLEKSMDYKKEVVRELEGKIDFELNLYPDDAELLFMKGLVVFSYVYTVEPPRTSVSLNKIKSIKKDALVWMEKSMDNDVDNKLSITQLMILKDFSSETAIGAIDKILSSSHYFEAKDRVELRRNKIDHLIRLSRFDEALDEMKMLNEKFPEYASKEWDDAFLGEVRKVKALKESVEKIKAPEAKLETLKIQIPVAEVKLGETKPTPPTSKIEESTLEVTDHKMWYLALLALILLAVCTVLLRRR